LQCKGFSKLSQPADRHGRQKSGPKAAELAGLGE
jgi:hypothetical protein